MEFAVFNTKRWDTLVCECNNLVDHSNRGGMNVSGADHQPVRLGLDAFRSDLGVHPLGVAGEKDPSAPIYRRLQILMWKNKTWLYDVH